jgi:hypothetical protein
VQNVLIAMLAKLQARRAVRAAARVPPAVSAAMEQLHAHFVIVAEAA